VTDFGVQSNNFEHVERNDDSKSSSQLNVANLILVNLVILIKNSAIVESKLKYGGCPPSVFTPFFTSFRELYDLTSHMINTDVQLQIDTWFDRINVKDTKSMDKDIRRGIVLARSLKTEMVRLGMLKIFEEPITPPFMLDSIIDELEEISKTENKQPKQPTIKVDKQPIPTIRRVVR
jgi:hypothetical protein